MDVLLGSPADGAQGGSRFAGGRIEQRRLGVASSRVRARWRHDRPVQPTSPDGGPDVSDVRPAIPVTDVHVAGIGLHLAPAMTAEQAVALGLTDRPMVRRTRMRSVCVASESGPQLAARAAADALATSGTDPAEIDLLLHSSIYHQGHDLWTPAAYVQRALGGAGLAVDIGQLCNGGMAAVELAASFLRAGPSRRRALITTGDRFCPPGFDRWTTDPGTVFGDGGTALVLSRSGGFARLRSIATISDAGLEEMGRGSDRFGPAPLSAGVPISVQAGRERLVAKHGLGTVLERLQDGLCRTLDAALESAGVKAADVAWFVLPHFGFSKMQLQFFQPLRIDPERTTWSWGRDVGHLGAGDQFAGLAHLLRDGRLGTGQTCVLVGAGAAGWTAAVLEMTGPLAPHPSRTTNGDQT
jgi:3-oxoacyl-[acyl-carrier-protein] synthase III